METCYLCGKELTDANKSLEHIIPNALGGHLKSDKLICKNCNNKYGTQYDSKLIHELDFYPTYLSIKRDSGNIQDVILSDPLTGEEYKVSPTGDISKTKPKVCIEKIDNHLTFQIEARNIKEVKEILKDISSKYGNFDIAPFIENADISEEKLTRPLYKYSKIGGQNLLSILKTAINYFIFKTGNRQDIENAITELRNGNTTIVEPIALAKNIFYLNDYEITHSIYINGQKNGKLYMIIDYFNLFQFVVNLNENYDGDDIEDIYIFDVLQRRELSRSLTNQYSNDYIFALNKSNFDKEALSHLRERFNKVADRRRFQHAIEEIIHNSWADIIEKQVKENEIIPNTIMVDFLEQVQCLIA